MLGSLAEADDAVQEAWLRVSHADASRIENMTGWLTTIVGRVCLNMLASRRSRREELLGVHLPDPILARADGSDPEAEALIADSVGLALQVILDRLAPAERLAFVLHDIFAVPFDEIAPSSAARRPLRAARQPRPASGPRVSEPDAPVPSSARSSTPSSRPRAAATRWAPPVLDPDVVLRGDGGAAIPSLTREIRGRGPWPSRPSCSPERRHPLCRHW
jgi:RNA polymerase sigma-70 factor (ECF subfamily)